MDISLNTLPVILMAYVIGMLNELSARLADVGEVRIKGESTSTSIGDQKEQLEEFVTCIEIHKRIRILTDGISKHFGVMILIQGFLSSLILCVSAFTLSTVRLIFFSHNFFLLSL